MEPISSSTLVRHGVYKPSMQVVAIAVLGSDAHFGLGLFVAVRGLATGRAVGEEAVMGDE